MTQNPEFLTDRPIRNVGVKWNERDWFLLKQLSLHISAQVHKVELAKDAKILDFGCADSPYKDIFPSETIYTGADLPGNPHASITINPDGTLPIKNNSFDLILSTQVLEHVTTPHIYLSECHRVLKPGGRLLLTTHGIWPYHADPVDYWRWTSQGLVKAIEDASLIINETIGIGGLLPIAVQLFQEATFWKLPKRLQVGYCYVLQRLISCLDRLHSDTIKLNNSMVYMMHAEKLIK